MEATAQPLPPLLDTSSYSPVLPCAVRATLNGLRAVMAAGRVRE